MGIRSNVDITVQIGFDNALTNKAFDASLSQLLDSMERVATKTYELAASETNLAVDFDDIAEGRLLYIEADGDLNFTIGGSAATAAYIDAVGASYPTGFAGAETFDVIIDGTTLSPVFLVGDQTLAQVVNRINSYAALAGIGPIAFDVGGQLRLKSTTTGASSEVEVVAGGTALATLGLSAAVANGVNSTPGTSPVQLRASALEEAGVKRYFLGSVKLTSLVLDNPSTSAAVNVKVMLAGDLSAAAAC